ncbi:unnamed protein product [Linum tenue]|uniref:Protein BIC1-like n=1 Tax=Linum tenue TaxID=586396 RepID=A0AAV0I2Q8_9ROSI|nr:unnamed protein product [Linum tenue]
MNPSGEYPLESTAEEAHATVLASSSHCVNTTPDSHQQEKKAKDRHGTSITSSSSPSNPLSRNWEEEQAAAATAGQGLDSSITGRDGAVEVEETATTTTTPSLLQEEEDGWCGREKLKRHRVEVAGRVWIPETWGQEELLKDWIDCSAFDAAIVSNGIMSARDALAAQQGLRTRLRTPSPQGLSIGNRC